MNALLELITTAILDDRTANISQTRFEIVGLTGQQ
jgi:hypothetical protein